MWTKKKKSSKEEKAFSAPGANLLLVKGAKLFFVKQG
jgi:hypothetical protein